MGFKRPHTADTITPCRVASISEHKGNSLGVCLFITSDELELLDVSLDKVDEIAYCVNPASNSVTISPI